jgi:hypothetical protein
LPLFRVNSFSLPFMNSVTLHLSMPRPFAYWGTLDRFGDRLRASTPFHPEKARTILTEWKALWTPDSVWTFSRKEKSPVHAGNRTTVSRFSTLQPRRCNCYAIQPHNIVVSNTFGSVYVRRMFDVSPCLDFMCTMGVWLWWNNRTSRTHLEKNGHFAPLTNDAAPSVTSKT